MNKKHILIRTHSANCVRHMIDFVEISNNRLQIDFAEKSRVNRENKAHLPIKIQESIPFLIRSMNVT